MKNFFAEVYNNMIEPTVPRTWKDLQKNVARILSESGFVAATPKVVTTVRGEVEIDVFAEDHSVKPVTTYFCECKHWKMAVPKSVVHGFRTVMDDYGANWGLIISSKGFQSGAYEASKNSNTKLLDWVEFQNLFVERWYSNCFLEIYTDVQPLIDYTEPMNVRIFKKADLLSPEKQEKFRSLRAEYMGIAFLVSHLCAPWHREGWKAIPSLPLSNEQRLYSLTQNYLPKDVLEPIFFRELLDNLLQHIRRGIAEFDEVFGERA